MAGLRCADCIFCTITRNEDSGRYQGLCSRGYTLANPREHRRPQMFFVDEPDRLVPVVDPYGSEYLRTSNVCERFTRPGGDTVTGR